MTRRLLLVEPSRTMREALARHLRTLGRDVHDTGSHAEGLRLLERRFASFDNEYAAVVFGWPALSDPDADALAARLEADDLVDLPVIVMSTDLRAGTRAWVAGRERSAVLAWKRYRDIDALLERLVEPDAGAGPRAAPSKFDNADMHLLLVDDSATIRRSLSDLFALHGYRTTLAATRAEAVERARAEDIDIAVVDFYLVGDTGDALVRDLATHPATSHVVAAVLTGTYSDHIIQRSLRAGALECLFKNESNELLLNRIDALARFVRQRRRLAEERRLLDRVMDVVAGPAIVLDAEERIRHVGREALALLGHDDDEALIGRPALVVTGGERLPPSVPVPPSAPGPDAVPRRFRRATGGGMDVSASRLALGDATGSVLRFEVGAAGRGRAAGIEARRDADRREPDRATDAPAPRAVPAPLRAPAAFVALLGRCLDGIERIERRASLLVLRASLVREDGSTVPLGAGDPALGRRVSEVLAALYRRPDHVADLGAARHAMVLRHVDDPQSWLLTRRILQSVDESLMAEGGPRLASVACLKRVDAARPDRPGSHGSEGPGAGDDEARRLLARCAASLDAIEARGPDRALLLDPGKLLAVYPVASR